MTGRRLTVILETGRLRLRQMIEDDAPFIVELLNDPAFLTNIGDRGVRTPADARDYIRNGPQDSYRAHGFGLWIVELRESGEPVGICGLLKRAVLDDVDIGFAFLPAHRAKGYAFESSAAVLDHARAMFRLPRVVAIVNVNNDASARLLEKLGMRFEKLLQPFPEQPPLRLFSIDFPVTP
jgi:[ribosomal protein S5]-alanine N-acetyltransferase